MLAFAVFWFVVILTGAVQPSCLCLRSLGKNQTIGSLSVSTFFKYRAGLLTLYSAGLLLSEATNLKARHIDSELMQLKVVSPASSMAIPFRL